MIADLKISLCDLSMALSDVMDLVSPVFSGHHRQVAYIALSIGKDMGLPESERSAIAFAAALHDSGNEPDEEPHVLHILDPGVHPRAQHNHRMGSISSREDGRDRLSVQAVPQGTPYRV